MATDGISGAVPVARGPAASGPNQYVAGLDEEGRSTVALATTPAVPRQDGALTVRGIWHFDVAQEVLRRGRATPSGSLDVGVAVGASRALVSTFPGLYDSGMHRTDTIDLSTVVSGSVTFHAETESVRMATGDSVMVPGVLHRWSVGAGGCSLLVVMIGVIRAGG